MTKNPYAKIKQNSIMTASPQELTLMLYDGAIKFGNQAIEAIQDKNIQEAHDKIIRVDDIILNLMASLDFSYSVAASLEAMYEYMHIRLVEANIKKDIEILEEVIGLVREFRDTWKEAMSISKSSDVMQNEESELLIQKKAL